MKLSQRSFPHPVVGNRDDTPGVAFQATIEVSTDKQTVFIDVTLDTSSKVLKKYIDNSSAIYVLHVECSNTLYRNAFKFSESTKRLSIPSDNLSDSVDINVFCCANKNISSYIVDGAHSDYGTNTFDILSGEILAISDGFSFIIDNKYDVLKRIDSIMVIQQANEAGDRPVLLQLSFEKIIIIFLW